MSDQKSTPGELKFIERVDPLKTGAVLIAEADDAIGSGRDVARVYCLAYVGLFISAPTLAAENRKLKEENEALRGAGRIMGSFIQLWEDCLVGNQMTKQDFDAECGLGHFRKAMKQ